MPCNCTSRDIDFVLKMQKKACQASLLITPSKGLSNEVPGAFFRCETAAQHAPPPPMPCNCSSRDIDFVLKMQKKACQASLLITPSKGLSNEVPGAFFRCETAAQHAPTPPMPCNCSSRDIDFCFGNAKKSVSSITVHHP